MIRIFDECIASTGNGVFDHGAFGKGFFW
jgi:hypothetical protein